MYSTPFVPVAARAATVEYVRSARPDAPVIPDRRPSRRQLPALTITPVRTAAARGLRRLADAVAPRPSTRCAPHATAR
jgi:hypothetical protein